ncbi:MAG TPA: caspase family protein [Longimicrobium sp.]|nr:caspase family protein [Longimicrobium sp.]
MAIGLSIHIGLNHVSEGHYGHIPVLRGCEGDAHAMRKLAVDAGFEPIAMLLGPDATAEAVLDAIRGAAPRIGGDGMLLLTYSGHGGRVRDLGIADRDRDPDAGDGWDETWCTHDRELIDDELNDCWPDFARGARILVVSDSCFSGDMIRLGEGPARNEAGVPHGQRKRRTLLNAMPLEERPDERETSVPDCSDGTTSVLRQAVVTRGGGSAPRALNGRLSRRVYNRNYTLYDQIQLDVHARPKRPIEAEVLLLAAAQDNEPALDGAVYGAFTEELLRVWNSGAFEGNYRTFYAALRDRLKGRQEPAILAIKPPAFADQRPFTI